MTNRILQLFYVPYETNFTSMNISNLGRYFPQIYSIQCITSAFSNGVATLTKQSKRKLPFFNRAYRIFCILRNLNSIHGTCRTIRQKHFF